MSANIVVIGSLNADFVLTLERFPAPGETVVGKDFQVYPGGKGANQAYGAARLGGTVRLIGQVGQDAQAGWLKQHLAAGGVQVEQVVVDPRVSTGIATITIDARGQNQIVIVPGANGTFGLEHLERCADTIAAARLVLLQLEIPLPVVEAAAALARRAGALVILDPAPARPLPDSLFAQVDYLTPNETELAMLTHDTVTEYDRAGASLRARQLLARGVRAVLVKLGARGALLATAELEHYWPAIPVTAVDTTAAGDAFNAAFAVALAEGASQIEAGRFATAAAAVSVTRPGAQPSLPTRAEVEPLLARATGGFGRWRGLD